MRELGDRIRYVNSVHPGYVRTPMVQSVIDKGEIGGMQMGANGVVEMLTMLHPIGRLGAPEDIGNGIVFLASDEPAFMAGAELRHRRRLHRRASGASGRTGASGRAQFHAAGGRRSPAQRRAPGQEAPAAPPASARSTTAGPLRLRPDMIRSGAANSDGKPPQAG